MSNDMVTISKEQLDRLIAEHQAAKNFVNVYFNLSNSNEVKYDAAVKLSDAVKSVKVDGARVGVG